MTETKAASPLRRALDAATAGSDLSMADLTVLATQNDPFRVDTPARHRDAAWLARQITDLGLAGRTIHLRGLHYKWIGRPKPDGRPYTNTDADWGWLQEHAAKAALWLAYIPFEQIVDERNAAPEIRTYTEPMPWPYISVGLEVEIPDIADVDPRVGVLDFAGVQPYKIVLVGEKSSLGEVLGPLAQQYRADLYLPTGEISDTQVHRMASVAAVDGRPMVVVYFSDCDPAGWQMPISLARKLQALRLLRFEQLRFQVHRVALIPEQVRELGLPSTPLKATERRAEDWQAAMGIEQTEIDALLSLDPSELERMARAAIDPYYDKDLDLRVFSARSRWLGQAQEALERQLDQDQLDRLRDRAADRLAELQAEITAINDALRIDPDHVELPEIIVPEAVLDEKLHGLPLIDSRWSFVAQTQGLIDAKNYGQPKKTRDGGDRR